MLPSAGSDMLRETIRVLSYQADQLVHAANIAMQQGNKAGVKAVVKRALEADPNNAEAQAIDRIMGNRLIVQNQQKADDIFGAAAPAPAAPVDDENPFADPQKPAPAPAPAPAPVAEDVAGDDDLTEVPGNLLNQVQSQREAQEGRWRAEVRAQLREANRRLRNSPVGVAGSLKGLLANLEALPDISPQTRQELTSQIRASIQVASRREASFLESQRNLEQVAQGAASSQRMLQDRVRREATLKVLSQQMNALVDEERYAEAQNVSVDFAEDAGITITKDSIEGQHFVEEPLMLEMYAHDKKLKVLRERAFVDAMALVLKSNIPFVDEPPIQYPDSDWWRTMSRRRIERYGAIELVGDNETERRIQSALGDETSFSFVELPLSDAVQQISEAHDIPIVVDSRALEEIGLSAEEPVNISLKNVSLRSFMRLMLRENELTYMIKDEVMQITTVEAAEQNLVTKVYPVGDLVVPIMQLGGMGGMGGGMGGMGGMGF